MNPQSWGLKPSYIHAKIHFWHGEENLDFPLRAAKQLPQDLHHCETHFIDNIGSPLIIHKWQDILTHAAKKNYERSSIGT